ncbi:hypothetical protein DSM16313_26540 [Acinetobacter seohaensis]|nr:hypothetical protein DSM16313_26540 [Acinetobacter seohaensis]
MALRADSDGFIIGERRLKEISSGINQTKDNTQEILDVLTKSLLDIKKGYERGNSIIADSFKKIERRRARDADAPAIKAQADRQEKTSRAIDTNVRKVVEASQDIVRSTKRAIDAENGVNARTSTPGRTTARDADAVDTSSVKYRAEKSRERDANGRFIGSGSSSESRFVFGKLKDLVSDVSGGGNVGDARGLDPTIDALGELKDLVSPVGGVFKRMSVKAAGVFAGRIRKRGMDEALPVEQVKANKEQQRHDVRRNKLLERLIDAVRRNKPKGGLLDSLTKGRGGLLRLLMGGGKALLKRIPLLGALFGGGMLAKDWGKLDNAGKGKGIGNIVGGIGGAIVGSLLGPAGTVAGGALGAYLGGVFGKKVGEWTDSLKGVDFAKIFKDTLSDIFSFAKNAAGSAVNTAMIPFRATQGVASQAWDAVSGAYGSAKDYVSEKLGFNQDASGGISKKKSDRQLAMYNALRKAGFSESQALAIGGEIGRENDYSDVMFGTHTDPAKDKNGNSIKNGGVLSWNRGRYAKFQKHMMDRGLMDKNGKMPKTQAALDAQAEFIKKEMESDYSGTMKNFLNNPNLSPEQYEAEMAKYVGWARGQTTIRGKNGTRVAFNSGYHEQKVKNNVKEIQGLARTQDAELKAAAKKPAQEKSIPAAKKPAKTATVFKADAPRPAAIKVPAVTPELAKIASKKPSGSQGPLSDSFMGQGVSDRNLAHIMAGGLGYREF